MEENTPEPELDVEETATDQAEPVASGADQEVTAPPASVPDEVGGPASSEAVSPSTVPEETTAEPSPKAKVYIALTHVIRNGIDYFKGDVVDMVRHPVHWIQTERGLVPEYQSDKEHFAHIEELKANGAIREA